MSSSTAFSAYPPHRHHTSTRILPSRALSLLSAYLAASTQDASLHPNALLTESGPKAAFSSTSSTGHSAGAGGRGGAGLVLHNLRRVEAGLKGECLCAGVEVEFWGDLREGGKDEDEERRLRTSLPSVGVGEENVAAAVAGTGGGLDGGGEDEWQDREEFEREQVVVGGGALGEKGMEVEKRDREVNEVEVPMVKETKSSGNKEERKKKKKEKRMKEKREKERKRQREGEIND